MKKPDLGAKGKNQSEDKDFIDNIIQNYQQLEESIVVQLGLSYKNHGTETGTLREDIWLQLFEQIIPKKFYIEHSIFIIDSNGNISREIDLAIVDQNYTPYIFQYGRLKFIPIEAVAAVVECKSKSSSSILEWLKSVIALRTSPDSIARMANGIVIKGELHNVNYRDKEATSQPKSEGTAPKTKADCDKPQTSQTSTRPIRIFCGYQSEYKPKDFDFYLIAKDENNYKRIELDVSDSYSDLEEWYYTLNHNEMEQNADKKKAECPGLKHEDYGIEKYKITADGKEVPLMSFNFLLNQLLMLINNPILFPHAAYARMFNRNLPAPEDKGGDPL